MEIGNGLADGRSRSAQYVARAVCPGVRFKWTESWEVFGGIYYQQIQKDLGPFTMTWFDERGGHDVKNEKDIQTQGEILERVQRSWLDVYLIK